MTYLLALCMTCAGDLDTSKIPETCEIETVYSNDTWADVFEYYLARTEVVSVYLLDEEDGVWLRRSGGPWWCGLED